MRPRYSYCFFWFFSTISSSKTSFPFDAEIIKKNQTDSIAVYFIFETKFAICKLCFHCHSWEIMEKNCVKKLYFWQISTSYIFLIRPLICVMLVYVWQLIRKQFPICVTNSFVVNILILFSVFFNNFFGSTWILQFSVLFFLSEKCWVLYWCLLGTGFAASLSWFSSQIRGSEIERST